MKTLALPIRRALLLPLFLIAAFASWSFSPDPLEKMTQTISHEIQDKGLAFAHLRELTTIGHRLSGSPGAEKAVLWAKSKMEALGFDRVWLQPVRVPRWTRGEREGLTITSAPTPLTLRVAALGNSAGTESGVLDAEVIEVQSLEEARARRSEVQGKIVFFNRPMELLEDSFAAYGRAVDQRTSGPAVASRLGAVAALVRSITPLTDDDHPHTGITDFGTAKPIPAAAISTHGANLLAAVLRDRGSARVRLELSARREPEVVSYNVIGEIRGRELPREIVAIGGHLDSWDLSPGAHDNGAGAVQAIEAGRALLATGLRPRRTVRIVLFMSEEFGGIGGQRYADEAVKYGDLHVTAIESDRGAFAPRGFSVQAGPQVAERLRAWNRFLAPLGAAGVFANGQSGTDVEPLARLGVPSFGYVPDSRRYFDYHHTELDRLEAVKPEELSAGAASIAVLGFLAAELGF